jgi:hypothetical protein
MRRGRKRPQVIWGLLAFTTVSACAAGRPLQAQSPPTTPSAQSAQGAPGLPTVQRMLEPGAEVQQLAREVGTWDVTMTIRPSAEATPIVVSGMVAERSMVGLYLTETMRPAPGSNVPEFRRIDYLTYDNVQARWEYASIDTRAPIGIMFAKSFASGPGTEVTVYFDNFPNPGLGDVGGGVRARHVDTRESDDHTFKRQYWTRPGEPEWLAIQYEYTRRR